MLQRKQPPPSDSKLTSHLLLLLLAVVGALIIRISLHENRFRLEGIKRDLVKPLARAPLPTDTPTPTPIQPIVSHNPHTGWKIVRFDDYKLQISFPYSFAMLYYPKSETINSQRKSSLAYLDLTNSKEKINITLFLEAPGFGMPGLESREIPLMVDGKEVVIEGERVMKILSFPIGSTPPVDGSYFTIIQNPYGSALSISCYVQSIDTSLCDQVIATIKFLK